MDIVTSEALRIIHIKKAELIRINQDHHQKVEEQESKNFSDIATRRIASGILRKFTTASDYATKKRKYQTMWYGL